MRRCAVNIGGILICKEAGSGMCVFLQNENINGGSISNLEESLKKQSPESLQALENNYSGTRCAISNSISIAAQNELSRREVK